jgi:hypothetical protein
MGGIGVWVLSEWRRRWMALLALALLIAFAGGVALAVVVGARRADSAIERYLRVTNHPNAEVMLRQTEDPTDVDLSVLPTSQELADEVAAVDGVRGVSVYTWLGIAPEGTDVFFNFAFGADRGAAPSSFIVEGRAVDPERWDEVMVNEAALDEWEAKVGQPLRLQSLGPEQLETFIGLAQEEPAGPTVEVTVVGVTRDIEAITDRPEAVVGVTPAFLDRWGDQIINIAGIALVSADETRLDEVVSDLGDVQPEFYEAGPQSEDFVGRIDRTVDVEVSALWAFAAAAAAAGTVIVGMAFGRHGSRVAAEHRVRAALGMSPGQLLGGTMLVTVPALVLGAAAAVAVAVALSPLFPRGVAKLAEVDGGVYVDRPALVLGGAAVFFVAALVTAVSAMAAVSASRRAERTAATARPSRAAALVSALPPVPALGARMAFTGGRRRGLALGWSGLAAVAVAVGGVLAVATVTRSVTNLFARPALYGAP